MLLLAFAAEKKLHTGFPLVAFFALFGTTSGAALLFFKFSLVAIGEKIITL